MSQPVALLLSILVEGAVAAALLAWLRWGSPGRAVLAAAVGTLVTHWAVWAFMPGVIREIEDGLLSLEEATGWDMTAPLDLRASYWIALLLVEGAVVLVETLAYRFVARLSWRRAFVTSLIANAASTLVGLAIYAVRSALR